MQEKFNCEVFKKKYFNIQDKVDGYDGKLFSWTDQVHLVLLQKIFNNNRHLHKSLLRSKTCWSRSLFLELKLDQSRLSSRLKWLACIWKSCSKSSLNSFTTSLPKSVLENQYKDVQVNLNKEKLYRHQDPNHWPSFFWALSSLSEWVFLIH